jgi:hypothetical protein
MISKLKSLFKKDDPEIEFYSIIPGLEQVSPPIKAGHDLNPTWLKSRLEETKIRLDDYNDDKKLDGRSAGDTFFIEKCPGIRDMMSKGIHLKTWQDIRVNLITNEGSFSIDTPTSTAHLVNGKFINPEVQSHNGQQFPEFAQGREDTWPHILKIMSNWRIVMNKDWQLILLPTYYSNYSNIFSAVPGIFNPEFGNHLNINIQIHRRAPFSFVIPAGTPIVKMIPVKKHNNFNFKIRKVTQKDVEIEQTTLALIKKRYVSSRKEQKKDIDEARSSISKCPFFHK